MIFNWDYWGYRSAFALIAWIPLSYYLFTRERPVKAGTHVLVWGMMWLPEAAAFDFPALPPFNKYSIAALCALMGLYLKARPRLTAARFGRGLDVLVFIMMAGQIGTVLTNSDPLEYGSWKTIHLPAFLPYDGLSQAVRDFVEVCIPLVLGRALIRSRRDLHDMLEILVIGGLIYSIPIFYELRMSPMLHQNVYGFASRDDWLQNVRLGGYRPTVFMGHGLVVGFFMFLSTTAAVILHKAGKRAIWGIPMGYIVGFLFLLLVLVKATAAILYAAAGFVLIRWLSIKTQLRILLLLAVIVVSYPFSRLTNVFPVEALLQASSTFGADRVQSMQFRFDNEDILVLKGMERPFFGWGGFSRERVYSEETGKDLVVQDGAWIARFGTHGTVGFVCYFACLLVPLFMAARKMKRIKSGTDRALLTGLAFMVTVCCVNMLPNMHLPVLQFFFAAGLATLLDELPRQAALAARAAKAKEPAAKSSAPTPVEPPPGGGLRHVG
jgi:hypothetical protein